MEIGRGLVRVGPTSAIARSSTSFVRECGITDRVGAVLVDRNRGLIDVPLIRAVDLLAGNLGEFDRVSVVERRVGLTLQGQVCLTKIRRLPTSLRLWVTWPDRVDPRAINKN